MAWQKNFVPTYNIVELSKLYRILLNKLFDIGQGKTISTSIFLHVINALS